MVVTDMRELIIAQIKRIAGLNGGQAPGQKAFRASTGIPDHKWRGVHWVRWSDALADAGFEARDWVEKLDSDALLQQFAQLILFAGRMLTDAELRMMRRNDHSVPSPKTLRTHFAGRGALLRALHALAASDSSLNQLSIILPPEVEDSHRPTSKTSDGHVYLIRSGPYFKIGRSNQIEKRVREIRVALPDQAELVHAIVTDDPAGIEAYWHRRFASCRANGEWFKLSPEDLKVFQRRRFQ